MSGIATAIAVGAGASLYAGNQAKQQAKGAAYREGVAADEAEALNRERYAEAQGYLSPFIEREASASNQLQAEMGLPGADPSYTPRDITQIPGYQDVMDESLRGAAQSATMSGATTYGGRRLEEAGKVGAGVQQSYYNNYMNLLQNMATPTATTNISSLGVGQGQVIAQQNLAATGRANDYKLQGVAAHNAAISDIMGGATSLGAGALAGGYI